MDVESIKAFTYEGIGLVLAVIAFIFILLVTFSWYGWRKNHTQVVHSPYTGHGLILGMDMAKSIARYIEEYAAILPHPNATFDIQNAAICEETGRVFPNCVTSRGRVRLDWSFLSQHHPGNYVVWGALTEVQKATIRCCHQSMEGFQLDIYSVNPLPQRVDSIAAYAKPGPLYVDLATKTLLGWKLVPGTELEILVIQYPLYESIDEAL